MPAPGAADGALLIGCVCAILLLVSARSGSASRAAAGAKDAEKHAASYKGKVRLLAGSLLLAGGVAAGAVFNLLAPVPPILRMAFQGLLFLALLGLLIGLRAVNQLQLGFEMQRSKAGKK